MQYSLIRANNTNWKSFDSGEFRIVYAYILQKNTEGIEMRFREYIYTSDKGQFGFKHIRTKRDPPVVDCAFAVLHKMKWYESIIAACYIAEVSFRLTGRTFPG